MERTATTVLLERDAQFEQLAVQIDAAIAGEGSIAALEGEAGIGKSALLSQVRRRARHSGMRVLGARGGELERDFGYGVVRQLFDAPLAAMSAEQRERILGEAAGLASSALSVGGAAPGHVADAGAVLHGLYWLTANLAMEGPLLIAVDDAHWADAASIGYLSYLARRVDGLALLVVYATRIGEGASEQLPARAEPGLVGNVVRPAVLSERATAELIDRLLEGAGSPEFAHACRVATGGNPFLLQELLRALHADGIAPDSASCRRVEQIAPDTISRAILARLRRLGHDATQLAFAIAVLGRSAELRHAAALASLDPVAAGAAADALTTASILRVGRPLEFIHPIVRTTVYAEIPAAQRAASHKRAASLLEADGVAAAECAAHLMVTEPAGDRAVVRRLRAAADEVRDRGAPAAACGYLARALAEPPAQQDRADVTYELGSAELSAGRPGAIEHLRDALRGELEPRLQMPAVTDFAGALGVAGRVQEGVELLGSLIAKLAPDGDAEVAMKIEGVLACTAQLDPATSGQVRQRLARWEGRLSGATVGERMLLSGMAFDAIHRPGPAARAAELAELALGDGQTVREQTPHAANYPLAAWALVSADRLERAEQIYTIAVEHARERGSLIGFAIATGCRCQVRFRQGRIAEAEAEAEARGTLESAADIWALGRPMLIACVLDAMVERADFGGCERFLAEHRAGEDLDGYSMASRLLYSRGHLRLAAGEPRAALRDFEQIRGREAASGLETAAVPTRASAALAHAQLGDAARAAELAHEELERARIWGAPSTLSFALRAAGVVTGGDDGIELLREAVSVLDGSPPRYERMRSLTDYGAALRRAGHRREAREPLRRALELAERSGALRTAARARDELLATGARPRRTALSGADALTPSERRVCRLAADGLSNREIAQALFVTVRTVEGHLTQTYMKLDITSREQLAGALAATA